MRDSHADVKSITAGHGVSYVYVDEDLGGGPAGATVHDGIKLILVNRKFLEDIKDPVMRDVVESGLLVHEGYEIVFGEIEKRNKIVESKKSLNKSFYHTLDNILGDVYIEAKGESKYPAFAKYLSTMLSRLQVLTIQDQPLKPKTDMEKAIDELIKKAGIKVNPALLKTLAAFYQAVRFGEVQLKLIDQEVEKDLSFIVPRVFVARRGESMDDVMERVDEIYHYLDKKYGIPPELRIELKFMVPGKGGANEDGKDGQCQGGKAGDKEDDKGQKTIGTINILPWKNKEQIDKAAKDAMKEASAKLDRIKREGSPGGLLGGPDHAQLTQPTERDVQFYMSTISKHYDTIARLQAFFKRLSGKRGFVPSMEGDLNLKPSSLQQAYMDSFSPGGDERPHYLVPRPSIPDIDLVMALDQSGSTYGTSPLFSEVSICVLEAAKRVGKIRTGVVGFGDGIRVMKDFWEPVEAGRFFPQSDGGTPMAEGLDQALRFNWRRGGSIRRVLVLATDGYPDDWHKVDRPVEDLKRMHITPIALCVGVDANDDFKKRFDQVYSVDKAEDLTEAFLKAFIEHALLRIRPGR